MKDGYIDGSESREEKDIDRTLKRSRDGREINQLDF